MFQDHSSREGIKLAIIDASQTVLLNKYFAAYQIGDVFPPCSNSSLCN